MTRKQKDFVNQYLKHRCKITAHNIVYGDTGNFAAAESAANRLLRIPEIAETIRQVEDAIRHEVEEEFKARYREELLTIYDKRLLLKKIATGEIYIEQKYKGKNCTQCSQYITSNINQMLAGLREDSKVAGHYPYKQNGKWVIPAQQTDQVEKTNPENPEQKTIENVSPLQGERGSTRDEQEMQDKTQHEKENNRRSDLNEANEKDINKRIKGQQIVSPPEAEERGPLAQDENPQQKTTENVSPLQGERGKSREQLSHETPPENDNKRQQIEKIKIDNTANYQACDCEHDSPPINTSRNVISQEKLRELLYPQKPKLSYMRNNP